MPFYLLRRYVFSFKSSSLIKTVSWICMLGMSLSLACFFVIVSVMDGFGNLIQKRLLTQQAHLFISFPDPIKVRGLTTQKIQEQHKSLILQNLNPQQISNINKLVLFEKQQLVLQHSQGIKILEAISYASQKQWQYILKNSHNSQDILADQQTSLKASRINKKDIIINSKLALDLNIFPNQTLNLLPLKGLLLPPSLMSPIKQVLVAGVFKDSLKKDLENYTIYYQQGLLDFGDFSKKNYGAELTLYDPDQLPAYQALLKKQRTHTWKDRNSNLFFALKLEKFLMTLFLILTFIISCLGISSALFLLMTQKKQDLALFQVMGMSQKQVIKTFTTMGFYLAIIAICLGGFIGMLAISFLTSNSLAILPEIYQDRTIPVLLVPLQYAGIVILSLVVSWLACWLPTRYLSQIKITNLLNNSRF